MNVLNRLHVEEVIKLALIREAGSSVLILPVQKITIPKVARAPNDAN